MEVAPAKAQARREAAVRMRRVELRAEQSGNAELAVRELDAGVALAVDAELSERARELKRAGAPGRPPAPNGKPCADRLGPDRRTVAGEDHS
jgi:hypothetical protein